MINGLLGKKVGMSQIFAEDGTFVPVTLVEVGPCTVVQKKTSEKEGYNAVQLGFLDDTRKKIGKPIKGHFNKAGLSPMRFLREFRVEDVSDIEVGNVMRVDIFHVGDFVDVTGVSKGKGFAGVVKRWGFSGGKKSHGAEADHRRPGSIGSSADPSRVLKGKKMAGRMGRERVTMQNLQVVRILQERNMLLIKGALPGSNGELVVIRKSRKKTEEKGR
ncbi:MAG: 50S ribosomal protein L3 [Candidatus Tectomicrobia bacterium]|nr:50S ribosomal protein L3 [Candidatus Tectomicrobia bacterium]